MLALSNSGDTAELDHVVAYARRFAIPVIAMTRNSDSSLAGAADITLAVPPIAEACPLGLAPTTSTTMMLALGDAIAVALLKRKGFSEQDFQVLHPGGAIGHKLLRVSDLMHGGAAMPLVPPTMPMSEALVVMSEKGFGTLGVAGSDGRLAGIVTDGDLRRHMAPDLLERRGGRDHDQGTGHHPAGGARRRGARADERAQDDLPVRGRGRASGRAAAYSRLSAGGGRMSGASLLSSAGRTAPRAVSSRRSRTVGYLKLMLPALALVLTSLILAWPRLVPDDPAFPPRCGAHRARRRGSAAPRQGAHRRHRPGPAPLRDHRRRREPGERRRARRQSRGPQGGHDAQQRRLGAALGQDGHLPNDNSLLDLAGEVSLFHDNGSEFHTATAHIDLKTGSAQGSDPIAGQGPQGDIAGEGFEIADHGARILFTGHARAIMRAVEN